MRQSVPGHIPEEDLEQLAACASRGDTQLREVIGQFHGMKDSYDDMNFTAPYLGTIAARTLIVHGDRDEFFPVNIPVEIYAAIPEAYLWIVPNGEHIPVFGDRAGPFLDTVLPFLDGQWTQREP